MDDFARKYWAEDQDARLEVDQCIREGGVAGVELLAQLAREAPDDEALCGLGAGPFEDLVNWHGLALMDELDAALSREPRLRVAAGCVRVGVEELEPRVSFRRFYLGVEADRVP